MFTTTGSPLDADTEAGVSVTSPAIAEFGARQVPQINAANAAK